MLSNENTNASYKVGGLNMANHIFSMNKLDLKTCIKID